MVSSGQKNYKCFVGSKDDYPKIKPLCMFPKIIAYVKSSDDETKWMYSFIEGDELLGKHNGIRNKVSNSVKEELDFKPISNKKFFENQNIVLRWQSYIFSR